jgi:hypothetical protein
MAGTVTCHDEIVACCRPEIAAEVGTIMVRHAKAAGIRYGFKVPLNASYTIGKSWAGAAEVITMNEITGMPAITPATPPPPPIAMTAIAPSIVPEIGTPTLTTYALFNGAGIACDFLTELFVDTTSPIYVATVANDSDKAREGPEEHILTRKLTNIGAFLERQDRPRRAMYFCPSTVRPQATTRSLETVSELCSLYTDIDAKDLTVDLTAAETALAHAELPPSTVIATGHGLQAYWYVAPIAATEETIARHGALLKRLADHFAGDRKVCHSATFLRLPGSHNTKFGEWTPVQCVMRWPVRYSLDELEKWLDRVGQPALTRKPNGGHLPESADDDELVDVDARLAAMAYHGAGTSAVHTTQVSVSAALLCRGFPVEEVVAILLHATRNAAGTTGWNWVQEEQKIRGLCRSWLRKKPELAEEATRPIVIEPAGTVAAASPVIETASASATTGTTDAHTKTETPETPAAPGEYEKMMAGGAKVVFKAEALPTVATAPIEPIDLWGRFDPPRLPRGLLPVVVERFAIEEAELMGADPNGLALGALAVCAAALPDHIRLQVKRYDPHWLESARLWVGLIGEVSTKKTPIMLRVAKPLKRLDAELFREYLAAKEVYDSLSKGEWQTVERPRQRRLRIEDTTIEGAQEVLKDSPDGVLCIQDELSGWFGQMDKYNSHRGAAKDRGFWLQSFHGGDYALNRITRGAVLIENLSISLLGGIQPEPMRKAAAETVDDGLIQRLIPVVLRPGTPGQDAPTGESGDEYEVLIGRLCGTAIVPAPLQFTDAALTIRQALAQKHLELMACKRSIKSWQHISANTMDCLPGCLCSGRRSKSRRRC